MFIHCHFHRSLPCDKKDMDKKGQICCTQSLYEEIRHSDHKITVVLFMLPQEAMFSIES